MTKEQLLNFLQPGDVLLYRGTGFIGWAIRTKTAAEVNHSETYIGEGLSVGSTSETGVGTWPVKADGLRYILRPLSPVDIEEGIKWHNGCIGQPYDTFGLLRSFFSEGRGNIGKQWCSEHSTRFARRCGLVPFHETFDAEKVDPGDFMKSPSYSHIEV